MKFRPLLALTFIAMLCAGCATTESNIAPEPAPTGHPHRADAGQDAPMTGGVLFNGN
jgi:hypothetical protein